MKKERQVSIQKYKIKPFLTTMLGNRTAISLLESQDSAIAYNDSQFLVLATDRWSLHLVTLEVTFMKNKQLVLCPKKIGPRTVIDLQAALVINVDEKHVCDCPDYYK